MLDSMPDERFRGVVEKVAPLPDTQSRWGNPNLKVYNTEIYLTDTVPNVKPGVSAKAEIIVTNIADALSVPIQAITTYKGKQVAYVLNGGKPEPQPVEVGPVQHQVHRDHQRPERRRPGAALAALRHPGKGPGRRRSGGGREARGPPTNLPPRAPGVSPGAPGTPGQPGTSLAAGNAEPAGAGPTDPAAGAASIRRK